jgi:hypothetical protein
MLFRYPYGRGVNVTPYDGPYENSAYAYDGRINPIFGNSGSGDITTDFDSILNEVSIVKHGAYDIIICHTKEVSTNELQGTEVENKVSKELTYSILMSMESLKEGGSLVVRLFDLSSSYSIHLVYLLSTIFDNITIFKPLASNPLTQEKYLVCRGFKKDDSHDVETKIRNYINDGYYMIGSNDLASRSFMEYINRVAAQMLEYESYHYENISKNIEDNYDLYEVSIYWNVSSNKE